MIKKLIILENFALECEILITNYTNQELDTPKKIFNFWSPDTGEFKANINLRENTYIKISTYKLTT